MEYNFKSDEYYISLKKIAIIPYIEKIWTKENLRSISNIGPNMKLFKKFKPKTTKEFFEQYTNFYNSNNPKDTECGRSVEQFWNVANEWCRRVKYNNPNDNTTLETFMDMVILHAIVETFFGGNPELEITNKLIENNYNILELKPKFDAKYSIDIVSTNNDNSIDRIIQIKPISTFLSNNYYTKNDVNSFEQNNQNGIKELIKQGYSIPNNTQVIYMIYDSKSLPVNGKSKWHYKISPQGKKIFAFYLNELKDKNILNQIKNNISFID